MRVDVHQIGATQVAAEMNEAASSIQPRLLALKRHYARVMANYARQLAPGHGGPYADTIQADDNGAYSDHPAAHRLEVGFHGTDSLGRHVNQGPRPHFGPAADKAGAEFWAAVDALMDSL